MCGRTSGFEMCTAGIYWTMSNIFYDHGYLTKLAFFVSTLTQSGSLVFKCKSSPPILFFLSFLAL